MKFKFNWGHGVVIVMGMFMIFIITFVYKTLAKPEYDHQLVSEEYYKDELAYQKEMERIDNAFQLIEKVSITKSIDGIQIVFPTIFDPAKLSGTIELQRTNDSKLDFISDLKLDGLTMIIPADQLKNGVYNLRLVWDYEQIPFQINEKLSF